MARYLANENAPRDAIFAARAAGFDVAWMVELQPGASDEVVLALAQRDGRVLITFDKDFGELVFRQGRAIRLASFYSARVCDPRMSSPRLS
jgi:predicted nuclease of predicted toxin-antitoxin system